MAMQQQNIAPENKYDFGSPEPEQEAPVSLPVPEKEIDFKSGVTEEDLSSKPEKPEEKEDVLDLLRPKAKQVKWTFGKDDYRREYVQAPLSFVAKMQWFSLVGDVLDQAMSGEGALTLNSLLSAPEGTTSGILSMADFRNADTFVHAIGKLLVHAPDFLQRSYCIWLNVPEYERDYVGQLMSSPLEEGGLSDDDGIEIIEVFIDQNYEALNRFFRDLLPSLSKRIQARAQEAQESRQSKRSKATQGRTAKQ